MNSPYGITEYSKVKTEQFLRIKQVVFDRYIPDMGVPTHFV